MREMNALSVEKEASKSNELEFSDIMQQKPTVFTARKPGRFMEASLRNVLASRMDIVPDQRVVSVKHPFFRPKVAPFEYDTPASYTEKACTNANEMCALENKIMTLVCNDFLLRTPPHSTHKQLSPVNVPNASMCLAHVTMNNKKSSRNVFLPITVPKPSQIEICKTNALCNKNVQTYVGDALKDHNIRVIMYPTQDSLSQSSTLGVSNNTNGDKNEASGIGTVYIDTSKPVQSLVTTQVLQDLLFGNSRITSSLDFQVKEDASETYAAAVGVFQQYGNIRIADDITLTPAFLKRLPVVISMKCPEMGICEVVTDFAENRHHEKFGPNHTTQITEVMSKLTPFVTLCCETEMRLDPRTVEILLEEKNMPIVTSCGIEHCFAHNPTCGVSVYVGKHSFEFDNTVPGTLTAVNGTSPEGTSSPIKNFSVHVVAFFSIPVVNHK